MNIKKKKKILKKNRIRTKISKSESLQHIIDEQKNLINEYKIKIESSKHQNEEISKKLNESKLKNNKSGIEMKEISEKLEDETLKAQLLKEITEEQQLKNQRHHLQLQQIILKNVELIRELEKRDRDIN